MSIPELVALVLLSVESVLALGCLLAAIEVRLLRKGHARTESWEAGQRCLRELRQLAALPVRQLADLSTRLQRLRDDIHQRRDMGGLPAILDHVLNMPSGVVSLEAVVNRELEQEDKEAVGLCTLLTKVAPLTGLAGMLGGVAQALVIYLQSGSAPQTFIAGFAHSIKATFWGVMIAVVALFTSRWLWLPYLKGLRAAWLEQTAVAVKLLATIRRRRAAVKSSMTSIRSEPTALHRVPASEKATPARVSSSAVAVDRVLSSNHSAVQE
jgi:hypothetical protein